MDTKLPEYAVLAPAYGRDFKTRAEAIANWTSGKDWLMLSTMQYTSIRDQAPGNSVKLQYDKRRKMAIHRVKLRA
jgi:hypothetical protein